MTLRLRPGIVAASLIAIGLVLALATPVTMPDTRLAGMGIAMVGGLLVFLWWLFFSRAPWPVRLGAMAVLIAAWAAMRPLLDRSIIGGAMGFLPGLTLPVFAFALVAWAARARTLGTAPRYLSLVAAMLVASGLCMLVRTSGIRGSAFEFHWRWTPTPEERLLSQEPTHPAPTPQAAAPAPAPAGSPAVSPVASPLPSAPATSVIVPAATPTPAGAPEWAGFRGNRRDGVVRNVRIDTDWTAHPPAQIWRRPIGPGWSSFAVDGDLLFTQEQRGSEEIVASYRVSTGEPVWRHSNAVRFWESNGGAGPRGTPTVVNGRVYAFGATGILNALDAATGSVIWSRDVAADTGVEVPEWGFSSSPLVIDNEVVVAAQGRVAAYDIANGRRRWLGPAGGFSYSSPHLVAIDGVPQIVHLSGDHTTSFAPDGTVLWRYDWPGGAIVQPAVTTDGNVLINSLAGTGGQGIRRLAVAHQPDGWTVAERWTSTGLKPYFNDFVVHNGHAFGFDGSILSCIDLADGSRKWKGGRYGSGQLMLLAEQHLLLVLSDEGELALVNAAPDGFTELGRFKALEGKTWNHPALIHGILLVRNGEEMAAFKLAAAE